MSTYWTGIEGAQANFPGGCGARRDASTMKDTATSATSEARATTNIQDKLMGSSLKWLAVIDSSLTSQEPPN
jgi:hypothetical protein